MREIDGKIAWANSKFRVKVIPAQPLMVAIYLRDLMEGSNSASVLDSAFYGIQWAHKLAGCDSQTTHPGV